MVLDYHEDEWDHDIAFTKLLETTKKNNIKLNFNKIQYQQKEVEIFGETYTTKGHKPSDMKIKAITEMQKPTNLKDLLTFLGMVQYLSKFSPRIAEIAEPLWDLMEETCTICMGTWTQSCFWQHKERDVQATILRYYNPQKETVL